MAEKQKQITKNQHYVPQFYLKKFINSNGKLEILDCERRKIASPLTPKRVCRGKFFYAVKDGVEDEISQLIESEFQKTEDSLAKVYDEIIDRFVSFKEITLDDKMAISIFMSMQYFRGPYMRKQIRRMDESMIKQKARLRFGYEGSLDKFEKEIGEKISEEEKQEMINFIKSGNYKVETNNAGHLRILTLIKEFSNMFFAKEWLVYISKTSKKFVTSDNAVTELFPDWVGKVWHGASFWERTHYFTLSPDVLIVAGDLRHNNGNKVKRKTLFDTDEDNDKMLELNFAYPRNAIGYVYANKKSSLQDILDSSNLYNKQEEAKQRSLLRSINVI